MEAKKVMPENLLYSSSESTRKYPVNLWPSDEKLFSHEILKKINAVSQLHLKDVYFTGTGFVIAKKGKVFPESFSSQANILYFTSVKFYLHVFKKILHSRFSGIKTPVIFVANNYSSNYFHWVTEVLQALIAGGDGLKKYPLILPESYGTYHYINDSLQQLGFKAIYIPKENFYLLSNTFFITKFATAGNYQDGVIARARDALKADLLVETPLKMIYISRKSAPRRKIANEEELIPLLSQAGFETVYCEDLSFDHQRLLFSKTKVLISNHGAGLTNMIFMAKSTSVLELRYKDDNHNNCYFSLASALGINYYYQQCLPVIPGKDPYDADVVADKEIFADLLLQIQQHMKENELNRGTL